MHKELKELYQEHGPPRELQCDYRTEFKGTVKRLGKRTFPTQAKYDLVQLIGHDAIPASEY